MNEYDVAIVGSGFAGSILSRCLAARGRRVLLLERGRHPRFAIGESSTPLGAIALERLAERYGLEDLASLAAYGRWLERLPDIRRGLKRGFTFFPQVAGEPLWPDSDRRLLVAASPDDAIADSHWLRSDVDAFLVDRAVKEGVEYFDRSEVTGVVEGDAAVALEIAGSGGLFTVEAAFVVDASGPSAVVARLLGARSVDRPARFRSTAICGHFAGVVPLEQIWAEDGVSPESGPYPDEKAAVHHLVEEGWIYVLPFDHDCVSAGLVADGDIDPSQGEATWRRVIGRYPTLLRQFGGARVVEPLATVRPLQYRLTKGAGRQWAALPHVYAFLDPMFSTGIAWSLRGVERLAELLGGEEPPGAESLASYDAALAAEADQIERLLWGSHLARPDFRAYVAHAQLYFALVSFDEVRQRIFDPGDPRMGARAFLGGSDPWSVGLLEEAVSRLERWTATGRAADGAAGYERWVAEAIAPRNLAGLADQRRQNLYPVDLDVLVERAGLLGLERGEMIERLPRLRGLQAAASP